MTWGRHDPVHRIHLAVSPAPLPAPIPGAACGARTAASLFPPGPDGFGFDTLSRSASAPVRELSGSSTSPFNHGGFPLLRIPISGFDLLSFADLPGRIDLLPIALNAVDDGAFRRFTNGPFMDLPVVFHCFPHRTPQIRLCLHPLTPGAFTNLTDRRGGLPFPLDAVQDCTFLLLTNGAFTDLSAVIHRAAPLAAVITGRQVPNFPVGPVADLPDTLGALQFPALVVQP